MTANLMGGAIALGGAVLACVFGYVFTGWSLVREGGPTVLDCLIFALVNVFMAAVGALPGLLVMLVARRRSRRASPESDQPGEL